MTPTTRTLVLGSTALLAVLSGIGVARAQYAARPWLNPLLSPDRRATLVEQQMTAAEILQLVDGKYPLAQNIIPPSNGQIPGSVPGVGFVPGIARLGVPAIQETDGGIGVADPIDSSNLPNRGAAGYSTALPSGLATAATWSGDVAELGGVMIGEEAHREGFNLIFAAGLDLAREPRGGRTFEYAGEDPLLAGTMAARLVRGVQSRHVISTMKHFAFNDQETGRTQMNAVIDEAAARESDLLAFEFAKEIGHPGAVMCAFNHVNGPFSCEDDALLNQTLKGDWNYKGWVLSDYGATHSPLDINAGLDQESGDLVDIPAGGPFFAAPLRDALAAGTVLPTTVYEASHRILRTMFANGLFDDPPAPPGRPQPIDAVADAAVSQVDEEQGAVLLKNRAVLPLSQRYAGTIAVFGSNAANGVLSGGGSAQVWPVGGPTAPVPTNLSVYSAPEIWDPSSPVRAIQALAPKATVSFDAGTDLAEAAKRAKTAGVVVVFVNQWQAEGGDASSLALPVDRQTGVDQNALVAAVASANPNTIVVVENGGPVTMPWLPQVSAVLDAWFPGSAGGTAIANLLFGVVNPSGHLPITFPASEAQLPRPVLDVPTNSQAAFNVNYNIEGAAVGYKWFARQGYRPLFPFGFGLSYTTFSYGKPVVRTFGKDVTISETVTNTGSRAGYGVAQIYAALPRSVQAPVRLVGFDKVMLRPGETRTVSVQVDPRLLARFNVETHRFEIPGGSFTAFTGSSAQDLDKSTTFSMRAEPIGL